MYMQSYYVGVKFLKVVIALLIKEFKISLWQPVVKCGEKKYNLFSSKISASSLMC